MAKLSRYIVDITLVLSFMLVQGCSLLKEKEPDPALDFVNKKLSPDETKELAKEAGSNWLYGQGFGQGAVAVGGIVLFPPYALYVLGNGALSLAGYQPLEVTSLLPKETKSEYDSVYDGVTSGPGRLSAAVAGEEYRNTEVIRERYKKLLEKSGK